MITVKASQKLFAYAETRGMTRRVPNARCQWCGESAKRLAAQIVSLRGIMSAAEKQTEPIAFACMISNGAAIADFLLRKDQI
jgi:hypothetical protein